MRKLILIATIAFLFVSCSINDNNPPNFSLEIMPIESVEIPSEFELGETYEISMSYTRPNGCYEFNDFIYQPEGNTRTVAIVDTVYLDEQCTQAIEEATVSFDFFVTSSETYIFRFYQGEEEGEDQYLIIEVPVVE
ncbi:hypothetical protein [Winogradskyella sp. A3E31]|uniref:hypothetical protein n=1 Tax=Winogradskyella sp. A3E31 TaxID=3349637 RepID=UPI00398A952C